MDTLACGCGDICLNTVLESLTGPTATAVVCIATVAFGVAFPSVDNRVLQRILTVVVVVLVVLVGLELLACFVPGLRHFP